MTVCVGATAVAPGQRKALALLAYLSRRDGGSAPRETLTALLWGDSGAAQARASLRQALSALRRALGEDAAGVVMADAGEVALAKDRYWCDADAFEALAQSTDPATMLRADALCRAAFLEGFPPVSPEFDRWADTERSVLRARHLALLLRLCDAHETRGETDAAIVVAMRLLQADPLQEHVHRRLIRAFMRQKRFDAALRQFDHIRTLLADELGVQPEPPTLELMREVRTRRSAQKPGRDERSPVSDTTGGAGPQAPSGRPSIAVLPFRGLSPGEDVTYLGQGIAEEVIVELARDRELLVVARGSSFRFDLGQQDARTIGDSLGVRFILDGTVRILADRVRVTAHLMDCETGREVWAERFDRDLSDIFDLQSDIARTVTATVIGRLEDLAAATATRQHPAEDLESYTLVARGLSHVHTQSETGLIAGIACFRRAILLRPDHGRAQGWLAISEIYRRWYYDLSTDVADLLPVAERALALDPRDPKAHCALGVGHMLLRNFNKAGAFFEAGLRANPNDDLLLIEHGRFLMYVDRPQDGLQRVRDAMRLNPFHPNWYWRIQGRCLHMLGRHDEALDAFDRIHNPPFWVFAYVAACHRMLGNTERANVARDILMRKRPSFEIAAFRAMFPFKNDLTATLFFESLE